MKKSKDGAVSVDVLARLFGLTPRRIQQLTAEGVIPRSERGQYALVPCVQAYVGHLRSTIEQTQRETARLDTSDGGQRLKAAQASLAELDLALRTGRVVPVADVERDVGVVFDRLRAKLVALPGKWGPMLVGCRTIAEATARLEPAVHDAMADLSYAGDEVSEGEAA